MPRILVVDDEEHIRQLFELELTEAGYEVFTIARSVGVHEKIENSRPHVVILDIRLEDHHGLDLLQQIRAAYPKLSIILCSAYDSYKSEPKAAAADYYVIKSHDLTELKMKVQRAVTENATKVQSAPQAQSILPPCLATLVFSLATDETSSTGSLKKSNPSRRTFSPCSRFPEKSYSSADNSAKFEGST